jgi:hypothetical protein
LKTETQSRWKRARYLDLAESVGDSYVWMDLGGFMFGYMQDRNE